MFVFLNKIIKKNLLTNLLAINSKNLIWFSIKEIRKEYPDWKEIVIIKDNASYHHAIEVQELAKKLNIKIVFLPAYCPNLNLIKRVWKFMKSKIKNIYYKTFNDFYNTVINFFGHFEEYKEDIKTLLNHKFQIIKAV